ncbi:MAG: family 43 glycosylhydrolase [Bacteroidales bacterium]
MKTFSMFRSAAVLLLFWYGLSLSAQNPFIRNQFTADPSARVFGDRVYVFPSHDILANEERGRIGWFCMEDYHVFSSTDLRAWTDHGMIVTQEKVPWVDAHSYSMWAPDCIERNGRYYFYFPANKKDTTNGRGFTVGVAVADRPEGPYTPEAASIPGVVGFDPNVFIDSDGQAYLYYSIGHLFGAKLKENMVELASDPVILQKFPDVGLKEGPYLFERNGVYYMTYPHVENKTERLEYATGKSPLGPFEYAGVIMDESPTGCWTNHHSIIRYQEQWYLFYHHNDYSPGFDKARSVRVDSLFFEADGSIRKVTPTLRGVGITPAREEIQVDRYSAVSVSGTSLRFLYPFDTFQGWVGHFEEAGSWMRYNRVDFGPASPASVVVKATGIAGGRFEIRTGDPDGEVLAEVVVPDGLSWHRIRAELSDAPTGIEDLVLVSVDGDPVDVDWIRFVD